MAKCKDCINYDVCSRMNVNCDRAAHCEMFKDRLKFVELPCNIGDKVYYQMPDAYYYTEVKIRGFEFEKDKRYFIFKVCGMERCVDVEFLNDRIFLTKEAAEQALRERK